MWVQSLGWEDPLEEGMAIHSSILAWRIPWTEEPRGLQSTGLHRVRHACSLTPVENRVRIKDYRDNTLFGRCKPRAQTVKKKNGVKERCNAVGPVICDATTASHYFISC